MSKDTEELISKVYNLCVEAGLSYDRTPPVQVSPGVWMFMAVEMNVVCKTKGQCRERQHFVVSKGTSLELG